MDTKNRAREKTAAQTRKNRPRSQDGAQVILWNRLSRSKLREIAWKIRRLSRTGTRIMRASCGRAERSLIHTAGSHFLSRCGRDRASSPYARRRSGWNDSGMSDSTMRFPLWISGTGTKVPRMQPIRRGQMILWNRRTGLEPAAKGRARCCSREGFRGLMKRDFTAARQYMEISSERRAALRQHP